MSLWDIQIKINDLIADKLVIHDVVLIFFGVWLFVLSLAFIWHITKKVK